MINEIFLTQIKKYNPNNINEIKNSMKEVLQDVILIGLSKSDFFAFAAFYGGTSLRIFRNLPRFSEDLDFTFITDKKDFTFIEYIKKAQNELASLGIASELYYKEKKTETSVDSCYLKFNLKELFDMSFPEYSSEIIFNEGLTIKVEVEKTFFEGGNTEIKLLTYPSYAQVKTFDFETLFASKLLAVLTRKWASRIKGRDFYDYLFYISNGVKVNLKFLENGLKTFGNLDTDETLNLEKIKNLLRERFEIIDFDNAILDVKPFVKENDRYIGSFKKEIFISTIDLINVC